MSGQSFDTDAGEIAREAVKKTFAILGVDIDNPKDVEEFRKDLRFAGSLRRTTGQGIVAGVLGIVTLITAALWVGLKVAFQGGTTP